MGELTHIVIDVETLGLYQDAIVLSLGAVGFQFDPDAHPNFDKLVSTGINIKFDIKDQMRAGRAMTDSTVEWWKGQDEAAKAILRPSPEDRSMVDGLTEFADWVKNMKTYNYKESFVWSRGTYFDFPKVEHMYMQSNIPVPYNGWKIRDVRTFIDVLTGGSRGVYNLQHAPTGFVAHNSLHDAAMDACRMHELFLKST
jgi:hypothetical protein